MHAGLPSAEICGHAKESAQHYSHRLHHARLVWEASSTCMLVVQPYTIAPMIRDDTQSFVPR